VAGVISDSLMDNIKPSVILGESLDKLEELSLGLGAHLMSGWSGQFDRMTRYYDRFIQTEQSTSNVEALDHALTFFVYAHSLREWIMKWERLDSKIFNKKWSVFISSYPEMKISRDICNVTKHLLLTQDASVDKHFAIFWAYDPYVKSCSEWVIYFDGRRMTLGNLMYQILTGWRRFISDELLSIVSESGASDA
jgi:hypothetical protein